MPADLDPNRHLLLRKVNYHYNRRVPAEVVAVDGRPGWIRKSLERTSHLSRAAREKLPSVGRRAEYSSDDLVSIRIKAAAMTEHNSLRLP